MTVVRRSHPCPIEDERHATAAISRWEQVTTIWWSAGRIHYAFDGGGLPMADLACELELVKRAVEAAISEHR